MHNAIIRSLVTFVCCLPTLASAATSFSIHVEWGFLSPSNPEVIGFNLYQEGIRTCQIEDGDARAMDCAVTLIEPTTQFTLTASFNDGTESPPSLPFTYSIPNQVQQLYIGYLARAADQDGLNYWVDKIIAGAWTLEQLRINLTTEQQEYESIYGGLSREQLVSRIYLNLFMRNPDAAGLAYWTTGGGASVNTDELIMAFLNGASASDQKVINNTLIVASYYTAKLGDTAHFDKEKAAVAIEQVNGTESTVTTALAEIDSWSAF